MGDLERDTRVRKVDAGRYEASLSPDWEIWGPNGGYLCAVALRAAGDHAVIKRPVALYCHYLRVARFEDVQLKVETIMRGRRSESLRVSIIQDEKLILEAMVRTAAVVDGFNHAYVQAPAVPMPDGLPSPKDLDFDYGSHHAFWKNFDVRVVQSERFSEPDVARPPHFIEWYRVTCEAGFCDPFVDAGRTVLLLDTLGWPAARQPHPEGGYIAPSLDMAAWFHNPGATHEWVLAESRSPVAGEGCIAANGHLFASDGTLLGTGGTQLLSMPVSTS